MKKYLNLLNFFGLSKEGGELLGALKTADEKLLKVGAQKYGKFARTCALGILIAAFAPLIVVVPCLVSGVALAWLYSGYIVWVVLLVLAGIALTAPGYIAWRRATVLFPAVARDLEQLVRLGKAVVFNGVSLALFAALVPVWQSPGTLPLLVLVLACWLTLPACAFSKFCQRISPAVQAIQLLLLVGLLVLHSAFPKQMEQLGWAAGRIIDEHFIEPVNQAEITSNWATTTWFNNVGKPLVWYSGSESEGYRLWSAPGFDPDSGKELQAVSNEGIRTQILGTFLSQQRRVNAQIEQDKAVAAEQEQQQRRAEADRLEKAQKAEADQREKTRQAEADRAERERLAEADRLEREREAETQRAAARAAEQREATLARYLNRGAPQPTGDPKVIAVVAASEEGTLDTDTAAHIAAALQSRAVDADDACFTAEFVSDGLLRQATTDLRSVVAKLELTNVARGLLLASQSVEYSTNAALDNIISARLRLDLLSVRSLATCRGERKSLSAAGVGFTPRDARAQAAERLEKAIAGEAATLERAVRLSPN